MEHIKKKLNETRSDEKFNVGDKKITQVGINIGFDIIEERIIEFEDVI